MEINIISETAEDGEDLMAMIKYNTEGKVEWGIDVQNYIEAYNDYMYVGELRKTEDGYALIDNDMRAILKFKETHTDLIANKQEVVMLTNTAKIQQY